MPARPCSLLKSGWVREQKVARTTRVQVRASSGRLAPGAVVDACLLEVMVRARVGVPLLWIFKLLCCLLVINR